jgi:hypothetical protein
MTAGGATLHFGPREVTGGYIEINGERFYRIVNHDAMPPFLMSLVSDTDHWMFVSSTGALTAGRRDPDHALFPYTTDDRIHDSQDQTGGKTILRVTRDGRTALWEPFSQRYEGLYRVTRSLAKSACGNKIVFEEINHDLSLSFSFAWMNTDRFGFARRSTLTSLSDEPATIRLLDGIQNLLPHGLTRRFQMEYSTLADGYKENEIHAPTGLGLFKLSSVPADRPEPNEALGATTVWLEGLVEPVTHLLSATQLDRFRCGEDPVEEHLIRGRRGAYFISTELSLAPHSTREWNVVADVDKDPAGVAEIVELLHSGQNLRAALDADIELGTRNLIRMVATADGLQLTADTLSCDRHFSNVLFNTMRGGIPDRGYEIARDDFAVFIAKANRDVAARQDAFLEALPDTLPHHELLSCARQQADPDLERLAHEYLPFTFSRRHGDPSRPWNIFSIEVKGEHGERILNYQGNWRDIFQNWEALALSFPGYVESMIFKFADASTADGHNPYRVMRDGFDWEVLDPHDAWSYIGYWGDHQVVYLLKLLEVSARYHPGALEDLLTRRVFTYADVPYRILPYEKMLADPRNTIHFDAALDREIRRRAATLGADGKALPGPDGTLQRANLTEKLLVLILARLFNYIPGAGLWMNTQRPEWNDANNALVGPGVSMVTLYFLRHFLTFCRPLFTDAEIAAEIAEVFHRVDQVLLSPTAAPKRMLDSLGAAGTAYRASIYEHGFSGRMTTLTAAELAAFCDTALAGLDRTIRANRRDDGLYHSYNLMKVENGEIVIRRLYEMLEGQMAVLSSGALTGREAADLLDALRASRLYRADQNSYVLYPDRRLPSFFEKNNIPAEAVARLPLLHDPRITVEDANGVFHFNAAFRNVGLLREALTAADLSATDAAPILALYEQVFDHQSFTGRSGTFYKYEGLGCIYWHMVSKLLVAVQNVLDRAARAGDDAATIDRLRHHYFEIREGIGVHKLPNVYGAVPTDPYSHTPGFAGVQQPGMTGQVKEDIIARLGEMGVAVEHGRFSFRPHLLSRAEFLTAPATFRYNALDGEIHTIPLEPGTMAFTLCQTPVVSHLSGPPHTLVTAADGSFRSLDGLDLDPETSAQITERTGTVRRLDVFFG